jgi:hypothetical protein
MFNRYVAGLATPPPPDRDSYREMGHRLAKEGYVRTGDPRVEAAKQDQDRESTNGLPVNSHSKDDGHN